jgi:predicted RNase H-like HicB family nuclease
VTEYTVVIEKSEHNYGAWVPDLDGCVATGETLEDVTENIRQAIEFHIEGMLLHGEVVPPPSNSIVTHVTVAT